jgi:protein-tyrosine phosphatase
VNKIKRVLFICLGNTARSPAAEYLARDYASKTGIDLIFESAGFINAFSYMQPQSRNYLKSKGINYSNFRPQLISVRLLADQDLILTMELSHKQDIINNYSSIEDIDKKTFTLKEFNDEKRNIDIIDPYYTSSERYNKVLKTIDNHIERALKKIVQMNELL